MKLLLLRRKESTAYGLGGVRACSCRGSSFMSSICFMQHLVLSFGKVPKLLVLLNCSRQWPFSN